MNDITSQVSPASSPAMDRSQEAAPAERRLRLWPGVAAIVLLWALLLIPGWVEAPPMVQFQTRFMGPLAITLILSLWWLFGSRLRWSDRFLGLAAFAGTGATAFLFWHASLKNFFGISLNALPVVTTAWVGWLVVSAFLSWPVRRAGLVMAFALAWGYFGLVRHEGVDGSFDAKFQYRWVPTAEEIYLAEVGAGKSPAAVDEAHAKPMTLEPSDWPGFRGAARDGRLTGVRIATDWKAHPPKQLWRHRIGPGWSSFAVIGNALYTQEQRGDDEVVVCFDASTGKEIWSHKDAARFTELVAGAGPRATPTFHAGKIYTVGAKGQLNCLDAATGKPLWAKNIMEDSGAKLPVWGFSSSPLVVNGKVIVFAGGPDGKSMLGYDADSGSLAWSAGEGLNSYCSPHLAKFGDTDQALIATEVGLSAYDPVKGTVLWQYEWRLKDMIRVIQPAVFDGSDVLLGTGFKNGTKRLHIGKEGESWSAKEVSETKAISPYFNDLVVHRGYVYGFDGAYLTCVSLENGKAKWRERGYGNGQLLLLVDQELLLILTEKGEVALVAASPEGRQEKARIPAIESKTWNHPVVAHGKLFVRNGEEAACFELPEDGSLAGKPPAK